MIPIYWGIFVNNMGGQLEKVVQNQHVTFGFREEYPEWVHGKSVEMTIVGYGNDGKNEAYLVELPDSIMDIYDGANRPHITLSVSSDGRPVDSWKLDFKPIQPRPVMGTFGYFDKEGVHI